MTETSQKYRFYPKGWGKKYFFSDTLLASHLSGWNVSVASERKGAGQQEQEQQAARADLLQPQDHPASSQQQGEAFKIGLKMGHVMSLCLQSLHLSFNVAQNNSLIKVFKESSGTVWFKWVWALRCTQKILYENFLNKVDTTNRCEALKEVMSLKHSVISNTAVT